MLGTLTGSATDNIVNAALAEVGEIATLPEVTVKIVQIVENPKSTARDLHDVIKNDPALAARILKVVNSAFYGLPGQIANVDRAIVLLGLSAVKNIAIAASMTRMFRSGSDVEGLTGKEFWRHCVAVGVAARLMTKAQGKPFVEEGFLAGLIHDLGIMIERQVFPRKLAEVIALSEIDPRGFCDIEMQLIGADHQAFGMALASKWRFPRPLCISIGYHHKPMTLAAENRELPILIHVADVLACQAGIGFSATAARETFDDDMLGVLELDRAQLDTIASELPETVQQVQAIFDG